MKQLVPASMRLTILNQIHSYPNTREFRFSQIHTRVRPRRSAFRKAGRHVHRRNVTSIAFCNRVSVIDKRQVMFQSCCSCVISFLAHSPLNIIFAYKTLQLVTSNKQFSRVSNHLSEYSESEELVLNEQLNSECLASL
jgi:hypothetical protein